MVKHIVMYTLKEGVDKSAAIEKIAQLLEPLVGQIDGLLNPALYTGCAEAQTEAFLTEIVDPILAANASDQPPAREIDL